MNYEIPIKIPVWLLLFIAWLLVLIVDSRLHL